MSTTFHNLSVKNITKLTADTVSISFDIPFDLKDTFHFIPGQYLTLKTIIDGEEIRRSYSICSSPNDGQLAVAVKEIEKGSFSRYVNNTLKVGDRLDVMAPMGNFKVITAPVNAKKYVFYAAGSGITPVISMVKAVLENEPNSIVYLYYGNRSAAETIFKKDLDALNSAHTNFTLTYIYSREENAGDVQKGRIDTVMCGLLFDQQLATVNVDDVYACGPQEMIMCVKDFFLAKGLDSKRIHFELFTTTVPTENVSVESGTPIKSKVTVIIDDEEFDFDLNSNGKNILQAAQDEDADVPFSCKGGVCCTCRAKVLEGTVRMDLNFSLEEDEVADGYILTCQAHPTSERVIVSFDE